MMSVKIEACVCNDGFRRERCESSDAGALMSKFLFIATQNKDS